MVDVSNVVKTVESAEKVAGWFGISFKPDRFVPIIISFVMVAGVSWYAYTQFADLKSQVAAQRETIAKLYDQMNGKADGFWLPVPLRFGDKNSHVKFTLPISSSDDVRAMIFYDGSVGERELKEGLVIKVNDNELAKPGLLVRPMSPQRIKRELLAEDQEFQEFEVFLKPEVAEEVFPQIVGSDISILIVVRRSYAGMSTKENVPD